MLKQTRDVTIQVAAEGDAGELLAVQKLAFHGQAVLYDDYTLPPLVQTLGELAAEYGSHVFLKAMCNGRIVGSVRGRMEGDTCCISRLAVHPDHQNKGIGKELMLAIENRFSGAKRYELFTGHKSGKNLALYERLGYRTFGEERQSDTVTLILMEKSRKRTVGGPMMPDAGKFADEWIAAWNSHDLERVLAHYRDDFEITSPMIKMATGMDSGALQGKEAVRKYWLAALNKIPDLKFKLIDVTASVGSIALYYETVLNKRAIEVMFFDDAGKVSKAVVHYT